MGKMNITTWHPDTCGCEIHYEWDTETTEAERTHTAVAEFEDSSGETRTPRDCGAHGAHRDHHHHFQNVLGENVHKNQVLHHIGSHRVHSWSHNSKRELIVVTDHTDAERAALATELRSKFTRPVILR